jgi:ATP-dependent DNA ligase
LGIVRQAWNTRLRASPAGEAWSYELKLDGFRVRLHKAGRAVTIYSKNGAEFTRRFLGKVRIQGLYRFAVML